MNDMLERTLQIHRQSRQKTPHQFFGLLLQLGPGLGLQAWVKAIVVTWQVYCPPFDEIPPRCNYGFANGHRVPRAE
jgi:hypothetical protein